MGSRILILPTNHLACAAGRWESGAELYRSRLWKPQVLTGTPSLSRSLLRSNKSLDSSSKIKQLGQERVEDSGVKGPTNYQDSRATMNTSSTLYLTIIATALSVTILSKLNFKCTFYGKMYFPKFYIVVEWFTCPLWSIVKDAYRHNSFANLKTKVTSSIVMEAPPNIVGTFRKLWQTLPNKNSLKFLQFIVWIKYS